MLTKILEKRKSCFLEVRKHRERVRMAKSQTVLHFTKEIKASNKDVSRQGLETMSLKLN